MRLGVIGTSPGNGHPFSFSAIVNGYDPARFSGAGWPVIDDYLRARRPDEFGFPDVRVTHAWTQDDDVTRRLCESCAIEHAAAQPEDLVGAVDAVLIARDDAESHVPLAHPFLDFGIPLFIDKPLTLDPAELAIFWPHLVSGRVMSCSGLRFARELDEIRAAPEALGRLITVRGTVLNDWARYGIHLLDAVLGCVPLTPVSVRRQSADFDRLTVETTEGPSVLIHALGDVPKVFRLDFHGASGESGADLLDNFTAFRRTLEAFIEMVRTSRPAVPPAQAWRSVSTIIAGIAAAPDGEAVPIPDPPG
ncbi:MAG: Gfo/Idh/MocA family oxidoreductase [Planctomycetota bacterium]|jgi:predicted dehydrogenase